jgi:hypothetical protein
MFEIITMAKVSSSILLMNMPAFNNSSGRFFNRAGKNKRSRVNFANQVF